MAKKALVADSERILSEWDYEQNSVLGLDPYKITQGSTQKAHWICKHGHKWQAIIDNRFRQKVNCPYCSGRKTLAGYNDIATTHPELVLEWDYDLNEKSPTQFVAGSNEKVNWICSKCGNKYATPICHRTLRGTGCPECAKSKRTTTKNSILIQEKGSLLETHPELCEEWSDKNKFSPNSVVAGSNKSVTWKCKKCGFEWRARIVARLQGTGCPACIGKKAFAGYNDLATTNPEIAKEWHPTKNGNKTPQNITKGSSYYAYWLCGKCGEEWKAPVYSRTSGCGCPVCCGRKVKAGYNDLQTVNPDVAKEWHPTKNLPLMPTDVVAGSQKKVWWQCAECGNEWKTTVSSRNSGTGCEVCGKKKAGIARRATAVNAVGSLAETSPHLLKEWDFEKNINISPYEVTAGSDVEVFWKCERGHSWLALISSRKKNGCPKCSTESHTSFPEQTIGYYLSQVTETKSRFSVCGKELDVFLPEYNVGIEYNGRRYHSSGEAKTRDEKKVSFFSSKGIVVLSVTESDRDIIDGDRFCFKYCLPLDSQIENAIRWICRKIGVNCPDLSVERDRQDIYDRYVDGVKSRSLAAVRPHLASQWHPTLNGNLTPDLVTYGSQKRAWWICEKKHTWTTTISSRREAGCPVCAGKRAVFVAGKNDLFSLYPNIKDEWDFEANNGIDGSTVYAYSSENFGWKCKNCQSNYKMSPKDRIVQNECCPVCGVKTFIDD